MSTVTVKTQRITRDKLAAIAGGNQQLIRLLENLTADIVVTFPEAIQNVTYPTTEVEALKMRVALLEGELAATRRLVSSIDDLRRAVSDLQAITFGA